MSWRVVKALITVAVAVVFFGSAGGIAVNVLTCTHGRETTGVIVESRREVELGAGN